MCFSFFVFFLYFQFLLRYFFSICFFFFPPKMYFIKKKKEQNIYKKEIPGFFFVGCKFPPDKRGRTTGQTRGQGQTDQLAYKHKL